MTGLDGPATRRTRTRTRTRTGRPTGAVLAALLLPGALLPGLLLPGEAEAHPLGNFSVNRYDGLRLRPDRIQDSLVLDTAEIPTAQDRNTADRDHDGVVDPSEAADRAGQRCAELAGAVRANVGGWEPSWRVEASSLAYRPGAAGLPTARLSCELHADADLTRPVRVSFHSGADHARPGWKEITAVGEGVELREGSVPRRSSTDGLRSYPADSTERPLSVVAAELAADGASALPPDGASAPVPDGAQLPPPEGTPTGRRSVPGAHRSAERRAVPAGAVGLPPLDGVERHLAALTTTRDLTVPVGLAAIALALLLGAGHAALPGHAKLAVAACLARGPGRTRRSGLRSALAVGATVTATHTAGVLVVGLLLTASTTLVGERLLSGLGLAGGALVTLIGAALLVSAVRALPAVRTLRRGRSALAAEKAATTGHDAGPHHGHQHEHHERGHHGHDHTHTHAHAHAHRPGRFRLPSLLGVGLAGGLVPSPSALVVLLGAVALGRTSFGVLLVLGYGIGMALALAAAGLLLSGGSTRVAALTARYVPALGRYARFGGLLTALVVLAVGLGLVLRGASGL
ncbi:nickel transporter [Kitasatospora sp. NPDC051853]|uniref:HoxN/HupN/NixA family nickel/cobalt transporter n=1 Tax=Kitasatospora sp. NPDC051853 TaxID=3364058 RepID=UPI0037B00CB9